jgi:hypothetical protein
MSGRSGNKEPSWPKKSGETTSDNEIVWVCVKQGQRLLTGD